MHPPNITPTALHEHCSTSPDVPSMSPYELTLALWRAALSAAPSLQSFLTDTECLPVGLLPAPTPPLTTSTLAPVCPLGSGLFGSVCLARDVRDPTRVYAVKQVDVRGLYNAPGRAGVGQAHRASRELRALLAVRSASMAGGDGGGGSPYLIPLRGHCASPCGRWVYLIMEACPGGTLLRRLWDTNHPTLPRATTLTGLPLHQVRAYMACLIHALRTLHNLGIAHRDVKPSNVCLAQDGLPRLVDFNLCRSVGDGVRKVNGGAAIPLEGGGEGQEDTTSSTTSPPPLHLLPLAASLWLPHAFPTRHLSPSESAAFAAWVSTTTTTTTTPPTARPRSFSTVGSPPHMSPEVVEGGGMPCTWAFPSDVWALGVTAYQLLTGVCPWSGEAAWVGEEDGVGVGVEVSTIPPPPPPLPSPTNPYPLPPSLLQQCPALATLFPFIFNPDPSTRPTLEELAAHPFFSCQLEEGGGGGEVEVGDTAAAQWWHRPIDWEAVRAGKVPPIAVVGVGASKSEEGGDGHHPLLEWGVDTFYWGREKERQEEEESWGADKREEEEFTDSLLLAQEFGAHTSTTTH